MPITPFSQETQTREHPAEFFDLILHRGLVVDVSTGNTRIALETSMGTDILDDAGRVSAIEEPFVSDLIAQTVEYPVLPPMY